MSSKKRSAPPPDFKRIKAKVGKRAPKQLNLTDTSFKAVSVTVRNQQSSIGVETSRTGPAAAPSELVSSKGRTWLELTTQLHHPAAAVRTSALKGLHDALLLQRPAPQSQGDNKTKNQNNNNYAPSSVVHSVLSTILSPVAKSASVDDDDRVREAGFKVLEELLLYHNGTANHNGQQSRHTSLDDNKALWKPFLPLLTAFAASGLHSLDRGIRRDGAKLVKLLSDCLAPLPLTGCVCVLLPSYTTILVDHGRRAAKKQQQEQPSSASSKNNKRVNKKKRDDVQHLVLLQSMVALLRAGEGKVQNGSIEADGDGTDFGCYHTAATMGAVVSPAWNTTLPMPDLTVMSGERQSSSGVVLTDDATQRSLSSARLLAPMSSLRDLRRFVSLHHRQQHNDTTTTKTPPGTLLSDALLVDILSKLRDVLLEILQRGHETNTDGGGVDLKRPDMEEGFLVVSALHSLHQLFSRSSSAPSSSLLDKTWNQCCKTLVDAFPVHAAGGLVDARYDALNAKMCYCLMDAGRQSDRVVEWIPRMLDYLLPFLRQNENEEHNKNNGSSNKSSEGYENQETAMVVRVLGRLLLQQQQCQSQRNADGSDNENDGRRHQRSLLNDSQRKDILLNLYQAFFDKDKSKIDKNRR